MESQFTSMKCREFVPVRARPITKWLAIGDEYVFEFFSDGTAMRSISPLDWLLGKVESGDLVETFAGGDRAAHVRAMALSARAMSANE